MPKLSNADRNRLAARSLFIDANKSEKDIADILGVSVKTVGNYKVKDKKEGHDWLTLRAAKHISKSQETSENMYSMFISYMYDTLKEIREDEKSNPTAKAQLIVSLGDSFSKMGKVARQEDPEAYKLGIVKHTITTLLKALKDEIPREIMEQIVTIVHDLEEELTSVTI